MNANGAKPSSDTVLIINYIKKTTEHLESKLDNGLMNLKGTIDDMQETIATHEKSIKKIDTKLHKHITESESDKNLTHKLIRAVDQKRLSNGIVIKGFPTANFDPHEVKQNIVSTCGVEMGFNECYKFSRMIGKDKDTQQPVYIHMMMVTFLSQLDKSKVFERLKENGHFLLKNLVSSCDNKDMDTKIWIENRVTIENLKLRKRLSQLKREGKIDNFMMRSGTYIISYIDSFTNRRSLGIYEVSQLDEIFPENSKRKVSDSSSPIETVNPKQQRIANPSNGHPSLRTPQNS